MSAKNDGGPAFPPSAWPDYRGMSLRDWFAGQALIGFMTQCEHSLDPKIAITDVFAIWCYTYADAMLRAREKSQAPSASGASGGSCNPHDAASPYASPVIFDAR